MLKGIPKIISPELMKALLEMGHGDEIVFADGNFPSASCAARLIRCDGHGVPELLEAVLAFFPLDTFVEHPAVLMQTVEKDCKAPAIWETYMSTIKKHHQAFTTFELIDRFEFYERSKKAYTIVATGESALYANIILKKGVVTE